MARIVGNEGSVTVSANSGGATATHSITASAWSMTISRVINDVTAFGDVATTVVGGIPTYTGSISGFLADDADPSVDPDNFSTGTKCTIVLLAQSGNSFTGDAIISGFSFGSSKTGDMTVSMDFTITGGTTTAWA